MRVIAGEYGSRKLQAVPGINTRPTTDKIKENIFNMLGGFFDGGIVLDFYGGSGALAIEAVSRGFNKAVICERYRPAIQTIEKNIEVTRSPEKFKILSGENRKGLLKYTDTLSTGLKFNLVFIDPPYAKERIIEDIEWLVAHELLDTNCQIVCEYDATHSLPDSILHYRENKTKRYGQSMIRIYEEMR